MPMQPFFSKFPDLAVRETRTVTVQRSDVLPVGEYGFIELYCNEIDCDCRRVLIQVMRPETGDKVWATINYGWEDKSFYDKWAREDGDHCMGAYLDPLNPQSEYADELLDAFLYNIDNDKAYVDRLKRHYAMFKKALTAEESEENQFTRSLSREQLRAECIPASQISISDEAKHIARCAVACDARIVSLMGLVFFSTETGDAWMLDIEDGYAMCLACGGVPQEYGILETATALQIQWDSQYRIEGERFIVTDRHDQVTEYLGFPVHAILQATGISEVEVLSRNSTRQSTTSQRATSISKAEKARRKRIRKLNQRKRK